MSEDRAEDQVVRAVNPIVFISHDTRDAELAEAFSSLLKSVSAGVLKSFRTSDRKGSQGIEYGVEWYPEIIRNIQNASDVVCLLTQRSVNRPWILFEAGMAKGKLDTPILGVALGIELKDASSGPFAQFQNCGDDEVSLTKLVFQLVNRIPNSEPDKDTIKFQVGKFRQSIQEIQEKLDADHVKTSAKGTKSDVNDIENSSAKLFEEIKIMFQDLPSRIEQRDPGDGKRRRRRLSPGFVGELMHVSKDSTLGARIGLSFYRDKLPWVYDEGMVLINKIRLAKTPTTASKAFHELEEILMISTRHPLVAEYFVEDKEDHYLFTELPRLILRAMSRNAKL
jgi:hypothetical protein